MNLPIFDYCDIAWSSLPRQDHDRLQRLQNGSARIIFRKKKGSCPFSSATARRRKPKNSFSSDWAKNLAETNSPHQHLLKGDPNFPKITVEDPLEDLESENIKTWQKLQQEKTNESVTCRFY